MRCPVAYARKERYYTYISDDFAFRGSDMRNRLEAHFVANSALF